MDVEENLSVDCVVHKWGRRGVGDGEFECATGIAVGTNGIIYVADDGNHRIQYFEKDTTFIGKWGRKGQYHGEFNGLGGLAVMTCDVANRAILQTMRSIPELAAFPPGLLPICAAYAVAECIIATDVGNDRIQVFASDGEFIRTWGTTGDGNGEFYGPNDCSVGSDGRVYVADRVNHRLQAFNFDGTFVKQWRRDQYATMCYPSNICADTHYLYMVANSGVSRLPLDSTGMDEKMENKWVLPDHYGDTVEGVSNVLVCHNTRRKKRIYIGYMGYQAGIFEFLVDGTFIRRVSGDHKFILPFYMAATADGYIYATNVSSNTIVVLKT